MIKKMATLVIFVFVIVVSLIAPSVALAGYGPMGCPDATVPCVWDNQEDVDAIIHRLKTGYYEYQLTQADILTNWELDPFVVVPQEAGTYRVVRHGPVAGYAVLPLEVQTDSQFWLASPTGLGKHFYKLENKVWAAIPTTDQGGYLLGENLAEGTYNIGQ